MTTEMKEMLLRQMCAAIDMLENAMDVCPDDLWDEGGEQPQFWYIAYHALFWLDFYSSESIEGYQPPVPFNLDEMDPAGLYPDRVYTREELLTYLEFGRNKVKAAIGNLTAEKALSRFVFGTLDISYGEMFLYNMRHVQHHAAQLNQLLRLHKQNAPRWVRQGRIILN
ncbi:MAG: DinB family protein [Ignavibacteria bacterium]|nr:DinB family protein [Ignavibacteria bacterium]